MEAILPKRAGGRKPKWNWPLVLADVERGISQAEVALKYSIPTTTLADKVREWRKTHAKLARMPQVVPHGDKEIGFRETGEPAVFQSLTSQKPENYNCNEVAIASEVSDTELLALLSDSQAVLALSPEDAQRLIGRQMQILAAKAAVSIAVPTEAKGFAAIFKAFREASGLTATADKAAAGLLAPPRSMVRRVGPVREAEVVTPAPTLETFDDWPEGL